MMSQVERSVSSSPLMVTLSVTHLADFSLSALKPACSSSSSIAYS